MGDDGISVVAFSRIRWDHECENERLSMILQLRNLHWSPSLDQRNKICVHSSSGSESELELEQQTRPNLQPSGAGFQWGNKQQSISMWYHFTEWYIQWCKGRLEKTADSALQQGRLFSDRASQERPFQGGEQVSQLKWRMTWRWNISMRNSNSSKHLGKACMWGTPLNTKFLQTPYEVSTHVPSHFYRQGKDTGRLKICSRLHN